MTIEERAKAIVTENGRFPFDEHARHRYDDLVQFATEQDKIAKAEVYREIYTWLHYDYNFGRKKAENVVDDVKKFCFEHAMAMEGGKNE